MHLVAGNIFFKFNLQLLSIHLRKTLNFTFIFYFRSKMVNKLADNLINSMFLVEICYSKFFFAKLI